MTMNVYIIMAMISDTANQIRCLDIPPLPVLDTHLILHSRPLNMLPR